MTLEIEKPQAIFFDWDGTLVDSYSFLNDAHNHVLQQLNMPPMKEGEYALYFGKPRDVLYPEIYKDKSEIARSLFADYVLNNAHKVVFIEGADTLLAYSKENNIEIGVVSNKQKKFIEKEIEHLGWGHYFSIIIGGGEAEQDKPSGAPLLYALEKRGLKPQKSIWYAGDTENDLSCAKEAGCPAILMKGHEDNKALITKYAPLFFIENCTALREILIAISQKSAKTGS